jgi:hypothetical protein
MLVAAPLAFTRHERLGQVRWPRPESERDGVESTASGQGERSHMR